MPKLPTLYCSVVYCCEVRSVGLWICVQFLLSGHFILAIIGKGLLRYVQYVPL